MKLPSPDLAALEHSFRLEELIRDEIFQAGGSISFAHFMQLALYAPGLGYYSAGQQKLGKEGDFITAPEISPFFAKAIARQCEQILKNLHNPSILEFGAGSGEFAKELLLELEKNHILPDNYFILEVSAELRERQQNLLKKHCPQFYSRLVWLDTLPTTPFVGIVFANEVLDAMPVHRCKIINNSVKECVVVSLDNQFALEWVEPLTLELQQKASAIVQEYFLPEGYEFELNTIIPAWIQSIANFLQQGVILLIDYGYGRKTYYHPDRSMGTFKCYYQHHHHDNPLKLIGLQDMTAHVDFTTVAEAGLDAGCELLGFTTQGAFLLSCGILDCAQNEASPDFVEQTKQMQAVKKLILPNEMGEIVKVMALSKNNDMALMGFTLLERRNDL